MTSRLRVPRGGGSDFSAMIRVGRWDRKTGGPPAEWLRRGHGSRTTSSLSRVVSATSSSRSRGAWARRAMRRARRAAEDPDERRSRARSPRGAPGRATIVRIDGTHALRSISTSAVGCARVPRHRGPASRQVLLDRAPGQKARLLEYDAEPARSRHMEFAPEIRIEPGRDPQDRRLAATGRADQRPERSGFET